MRTFAIGTFRSIPIRIHIGALAIAGLVAWVVGGTILPTAVPGATSAAYLLGGVLAGVLLLASIFGHEASHALVARRYDVNVSSITLWVLGGVAHLEGEAPTPKAEARIAGAGPLFSVLAATALAALGGLLWTTGAVPVLAGTLLWLAVINGVLALFNLLPGAPLDGGRLLHAWMWKRTGSRARAVERSTQVGRLLGIGVAGFGAFEVLFLGNIGGLWTGVIGWFLFTAATQENRVGKMAASLRGRRIRDLMSPLPESIADWSPVSALLSSPAAARRYLLHDFGGDLSGVVDLEQLPSLVAAVRDRNGEDIRLRDLGLVAPVSVDADTEAIDALQSMQGAPIIATENGVAVGIVGRLELQRALVLDRLSRNTDSLESTAA